MKKIVLFTTKWKWWPYYLYKDLHSYLSKNLGNEFEVIFANSIFDYIKYHFTKTYLILSIIPFLFKPYLCKKFFFNPHWNWEYEKHNFWLWNKLHYLANYNLSFSNKIILNSFFLSDKLDFRNKYNSKIFIIPNYIDLKYSKKNNKKINTWKEVDILTVSSTKFFSKWIWIVDLWKDISKIESININRTIIAWWNDLICKKIKNSFKQITFWSNIKIKWLGRVDKVSLEKIYGENSIFLYWTRLDTWWQTIFEAMSFWLPILLKRYELWKYIFPNNQFIYDNLEKDLLNIINNYNYHSNLSIQYIKKYDKEIILKEILNLIKNINE